jgi:hypothetical protein
MNFTRFVFLLAAGTLSAQVSVLMNRYDPATTGSNPRETILNPASVSGGRFGKLYSYYVDGAVYAQPLLVASFTRNVLYVATMNDKVYAFDADRAGAPIWMRTLTDELHGITPVPVTDITNNNDLNVVGNVGILGTPVIDQAAAAMYLVARTRESGKYFQRLYKMALGDGHDLLPPVVVEASVKGTAKDAVSGTLRFDPRAGNQRPGLALVKGNVVIAWASHEDIHPYHGWVMSYDAATLKQTGAICMSPNGTEGGVWQSGRGPAVDDDGRVYFETGNGSFDGKQDWGSSLIKLGIRREGLAVDDAFTPHDWQALNARDADLGSTGPMLIPGTNYLVAGSKKGTVYLFDKEKLGRLTPQDAGVLQSFENNGGRILAGPAWWDGPSGGMLYLWTEADFLKAYRFDGTRFNTTPVAKGNVGSKGSPGGALTVSSDGKKAGTGIVWGTLTVSKSADHGNAAGVLRAYDAETLKELWHSEQQARRDRLGTLVKFVAPTVANGKVYVPNYDNAVQVYGVR